MRRNSLDTPGNVMTSPGTSADFAARVGWPERASDRAGSRPDPSSGHMSEDELIAAYGGLHRSVIHLGPGHWHTFGPDGRQLSARCPE